MKRLRLLLLKAIERKDTKDIQAIKYQLNRLEFPRLYNVNYEGVE